MLLKLLGLKVNAPDYTTLSRQAAGLVVPSGRRRSTDEALQVVVDSRGVKVYGAGEWQVRQHGVSRRRTWPNYTWR